MDERLKEERKSSDREVKCWQLDHNTVTQCNGRGQRERGGQWESLLVEFREVRIRIERLQCEGGGGQMGGLKGRERTKGQVEENLAGSKRAETKTDEQMGDVGCT